MPKDFRLTLWLFLLGLAVQTAYAETTKNVDPKNTQEAPETIKATSIVPPSNKPSPTTNTTNTTTTTFAPTTTTSNTTMPIPTTTKIDVQSNCTEGLPLACWISPEFKALKSKRCECKNGTTFIYNATRCEHMTVYQKQEYLPGEFELTLKCNYTLNECYQQSKLTTEKLSKKKKPNQPEKTQEEIEEEEADNFKLSETDVEDSLAGKGYAIAQAEDCWIGWKSQHFVRNETLYDTKVKYPIAPNKDFREKCVAGKHIIDRSREFQWMGETYTNFLILKCWVPYCGRSNKLPPGEKDICIPRIPDPHAMTWTRQWCKPYEQNRSLVVSETNPLGCEPLPPCEEDSYVDRDYIPPVLANFEQDFLQCERLCPYGLFNKIGKDGWGQPCRRIPAIGYDYFYTPEEEKPRRKALPACGEWDSILRDPPKFCAPMPFCVNDTVPSNVEDNPFYFEDDECVYPVQGCTELLEEILFCDKNATVKKLGNFIEKDYSKEEDKYAAQIAAHRKWDFVHVYVIIMAMLFGISICAIVVAALIYVLAFRKKKRFIKGKGAKTGRNISKSTPNKKEKNKKGAKLSPQDGSSMDVSIGQRHDVQPIKRRSTADNQTTGVESQTGTEPETTAQIV